MHTSQPSQPRAANDQHAWRVTTDGLIVSCGDTQAVVPFEQFGGLVLALIERMKVREGRNGGFGP